MISQAMIIAVATMLFLATETNSATIMSIPTCQSTCGNLTIPFPFGTTSNCSLDHSFLITCNQNYNPPKLFLNSGHIEVLDISLHDGLIRISSSVASDCYDGSGSQVNATISELALSQFTVSSTRNKFTAVGCDTYALVEGSRGWKQMSAGCVSWCDSIASVENGTCSGIGCCQTSIPSGVRDFLVDIRSFRNHSRVRSFNPCGYAFVVEEGSYKFSSSDLKDFRNRKSVPVVLDWSVGNVSCHEARRNISSFACRASHSECSDSSNGIGYRCVCLAGFEGNPYLVDGCRDIDECVALKPCEGTCENLEGSYSCSCPEGFEGDGKKDGSGCRQSRTNTSTLFYIVSGFMVPAVGSSWIFWRRKQQKVVKLRRNLFIRNGGKLLEDLQSVKQSTLKVFTAEDLKNATNNYNDDKVIHTDQHMVATYKGTLPDGTNCIVTVAKHDDPDVELFISEILAFSQLNHRNLLELIGCCLETQVPLLVYKFFSGMTLYDYIHDNASARNLSWDVRLRIATETAGALAYLHSASPLPIVHGGLSSSAILLHYGHTVKVCGFELSSGCLGKIGYLGPECFLTCQRTMELDVYSFGVVLAELLTGKDVISSERSAGEEIVAWHSVASMRQDELFRILDNRLERGGAIVEMLTGVAKLAVKCLLYSAHERPTMKEVVIALENAMNKSCSSMTVCPSPSQGTTFARRAVRRNRSF